MENPIPHSTTTGMGKDGKMVKMVVIMTAVHVMYEFQKHSRFDSKLRHLRMLLLNSWTCKDFPV